jgi:sulfite exporter TauE/SafE
MPSYATELPKPVRVAALLFVVYGVMVIANGLVQQSSPEWSRVHALPRLLLRVGSCGLIAYALMKRLRWGWWGAVVFGGIWAMMGAGVVLMIARAGAWDRLGLAMPLFMAGTAVVLGAAVALLLQPASRDAFR